MDYYKSKVQQKLKVDSYSKNQSKAEEYGIESTFIPKDSNYRKKPWDPIKKTEQTKVRALEAARSKEKTNVLHKIMNGKDITEKDFGIMKEVKTSSYYKANAQTSTEHGARILDLIEKSFDSTGVPKQAIILDTEWSGGGGESLIRGSNFMDAHIVEIGIDIAELKEGKLISKGSKSSIFLSMEEAESNKVEELLSKLEGWVEKGEGTKPLLSKEEKRSLSDFMKYSGKMTGDITSIINPDINVENLGNTDIYSKENLEKIRMGFDHLRYGTKTEGVIKRTEVGDTLNKIFMKSGYTLDDNPLMFTQNGLNADIPVITNNILQFDPKNELLNTLFNRDLNKTTMYDTQSMKKIVEKGSLDQRRRNQGTAAMANSVYGPSTLAGQTEAYYGEVDFSAHIASADAGVTTNLGSAQIQDPVYLRKLHEMRKQTQEAPRWKNGDFLVSTGTIFGENDLSGVMNVDEETGLSSLQRGSVAVAKNRRFQVKNQFTTVFEDQTYYGMVLKNIDSDTTSIVTRNSLDELMDAIQANTRAMSGNRDIAIKHFSMKQMAASEYTNMFTGEKSPYYFNQYTSALKYVEDTYGQNGLNSMLDKRNNKLSKKITNELTQNKILTKTQSEKFAYMFPRLHSEKEVLLGFKEGVVDEIKKANPSFDKAGKPTTWKSDSKVRSALAIHSNKMEAVLSRQTTKIKAPAGINMATIHGLDGQPIDININSKSTISGSLVGILKSTGEGREKMNFGDVKANARKLVAGLHSQGQLSEEDAKELIEDINGMRGKPGTLTGIGDITDQIASKLSTTLKRNEYIETVGSITRKQITSNEIKSLTGKNYFNKVIGLANKIEEGPSVGGVKYYSSNVREKMGIVDDYIYSYIKEYTDIVDKDGVGPRKVEDMVEELARSFKDQGIYSSLELTEPGDKRGPGLLMSLVDQKESHRLVSGKTEKSAKIFIPILNPKTGLIMSNGSPVIVNMELIPTENGFRFATQQEKALSGFSPYKVEEMAKLIKEGNWKDASDVARRSVNGAMKGSGGGATWEQELAKDLTGTTEEIRRIKRSTVQLDKFHKNVYEEAKAAHKGTWNWKNDSSFEKDFAMALTLDSEDTEKALGIDLFGLPSFRKLREFQEEAGLSLTTTNVKSLTYMKMHQAGVMPVKRNANGRLVINASKNTSADPRLRYSLGSYDDPSSENAMAANRYLPISRPMAKINLDKLDKKMGTNLADERMSRYFGKSFITESVAQSEFDQKLPDGTSSHINFTFANVTDDTTLALLKAKGMSDEEISSLTYLQNPTTRNDNFVISEALADAVTTVNTKRITLDEDQMLDPNIIRRLENGENPFINPGDNLGINIMTTEWDENTTRETKDKMGKLYPNQVSSERNPIRIKSAKEVDGRWVADVEEYIPTEVGSKFLTGNAGIKGTASIQIMSEGQESIMEKAYGKNIDGLFFMGSGKRSSEMNVAHLNEATRQIMTVGDMSTAEKEAAVLDMFKGAGFDDERIKFYKGQVILPSDARTANEKGIDPVHLANSVDKKLKGMKLPGIITKVPGQGTSTVGEQAIKDIEYSIGTLKLTRNNVAEYTKVYGADKGLVKLGHRELELLDHKNRNFFGGRLTELMDTFEGMAFDRSSQTSLEKTNMHNSILSFRGIDLADEAETGFLSFRPTGSNKAYGSVKSFDSVSEILTDKSSGYFNEELKGTIVDDIFDGKAYYMELAEDVTYMDKVQDKSGKWVPQKRTVNRVRMSANRWQGEDGAIHLTDVDQKKNKLFESMVEWREAQTSNDEKRMARASIEHANAVKGYMFAQGNALYSPHGYFAEQDMARRVKHSGQFTLKGISATNYLDGPLKGKMEENTAFISRNDMANMAKGFKLEDGSDIDMDKWLEQAEGDGIIGGVVRYPTIEDGSVQTLKYKVLSEADEAGYTKARGMKSLDGSMILTQGTEAGLKGDSDGDIVGGFQFILNSRKKAKTTEELFSNKLYKEAQELFETEQKWSEKISSKTALATIQKESEHIYNLLHEDGNNESIDRVFQGLKFGEKVTDSFSKYSPEFLNGYEDEQKRQEIATISTRVLKQVGIYSNMNTKLTRSAEGTFNRLTVGDSVSQEVRAKAGEMQDVIRFLGSSVEQIPISAKHGGDQLKGQNLEDYFKFIDSGEKFTDAIYQGNTKSVLAQMENLGLIKDGAFVGTGKFEDDIAEAKLLDKYNWGEKGLSVDVIERSLDILFENTPKGQLSGASNTILLKDISQMSTEDGLEQIMKTSRRLRDPSPESYSDNYTVRKYMENIDDKVMKENVEKAIKIQSDKSHRLSADNIMVDAVINKGPSSGQGYSMGEAAREAFSSGKISGKSSHTGLKVGAAVLGAGWLVSSFAGSPTKRHKPVDTRADQAPSSDGNYVDPMIYAGAPPGSEPPTARVSPMGGQNINIGIEASSLQGMQNDQVAALISGEIQRQTQMNMNININSQDSRKNIDKAWLQSQFGNAIRGGYSY